MGSITSRIAQSLSNQQRRPEACVSDISCALNGWLRDPRAARAIRRSDAQSAAHFVARRSVGHAS
jgi:hypothetical protein